MALTHNLKVQDTIEISSTPQEVFSYFIRPEKISKWWPKSAVCDPQKNGKLIFTWENDTTLETQFKTFIAFEKLSFPFGPEFVDIIFKEKNNKTTISVTHSGINIKDSDFSLLIHITQSWSFLLINLKMVIEHNIDLR